MRKILECAAWCVAVVVMLVGVIAFESCWPSSRKTQDTPRAVVESVPVVTSQISPLQYELLAKRLRAQVKDQNMSSGSAKTSSSASSPPTCDGQYRQLFITTYYTETMPGSSTDWHGSISLEANCVAHINLYCESGTMRSESYLEGLGDPPCPVISEGVLTVLSVTPFLAEITFEGDIACGCSGGKVIVSE